MSETTEPRMDPARDDLSVVHDPDLYARMSEPFADIDVAARALSEFFTELRALRETYRIPDVACVVSLNVFRGGDEPDSVITGSYNGDSRREPHLLAWALGKCEARFRAQIERVRRESAESPIDLTPVKKARKAKKSSPSPTQP